MNRLKWRSRTAENREGNPDFTYPKIGRSKPKPTSNRIDLLFVTSPSQSSFVPVTADRANG